MLAKRLPAAILACLLTAAASASHNEPMSAAKLARQLGSEQAPLVLDVRSTGEYQSGHVPGAVHIPHTRLAGRLSELDAGKQQQVVVYCEQGPRARRAESILEEAGYTEVRTLKGHMSHWRSGGYPTE